MTAAVPVDGAALAARAKGVLLRECRGRFETVPGSERAGDGDRARLWPRLRLPRAAFLSEVPESDSTSAATDERIERLTVAVEEPERWRPGIDCETARRKLIESGRALATPGAPADHYYYTRELVQKHEYIATQLMTLASAMTRDITVGRELSVRHRQERADRG